MSGTYMEAIRIQTGLYLQAIRTQTATLAAKYAFRTKRLRALNHLHAVGLEVYRAAVTAEEEKIFRELPAGTLKPVSKTFIDFRESMAYIKLRGSRRKRLASFGLELADQSMPIPNNFMDRLDSGLTPKLARRYYNAIDRYSNVSKEIIEIERVLRKLLAPCRSPAQILRQFPELGYFLKVSMKSDGTLPDMDCGKPPSSKQLLAKIDSWASGNFPIKPINRSGKGVRYRCVNCGSSVVGE